MGHVETIDEIVAKATFSDDDGCCRRPRINEFVNAYEAVPNGDAPRYRRGQRSFVGRVKAITVDGTLIEEWSYSDQRFERETFLPASAVDCIASRCGVTAYSLSREFGSVG